MQQTIAVAALAALLGSTALAHDEAAGPNGGAVVDSAGHHLELVTSGTAVTLFVTGEEGEPLDTAGTSKGRAVIQSGGKNATVQLTPAAPNKLVGVLPKPLAAGAKVVVAATMADGHALQARFALK